MNQLFSLVFEKTKANERKRWLLEAPEHEHQPIDQISAPKVIDQTVSFQDFFNKEFIQFSYADNLRSIPHLVDGLKPSQRKVLFACFKRKLKQEIVLLIKK